MFVCLFVCVHVRVRVRQSVYPKKFCRKLGFFRCACVCKKKLFLLRNSADLRCGIALQETPLLNAYSREMREREREREKERQRERQREKERERERGSERARERESERRDCTAGDTLAEFLFKRNERHESMCTCIFIIII